MIPKLLFKAANNIGLPIHVGKICRKLFTSILFLIPFIIKAQVSVIPSDSAALFAKYLSGSGVTITNASLNCPKDASGIFNGVNSTLGLDSGIILTTGNIISLLGPNLSSSTGYNNSGDGDSTLNKYLKIINPSSPYLTQNACVFEFDVQSSADTLVFEYVFASDEYSEFANSNYNDLFAFFISGPGIAGVQNIALIPNTTIPVTINTVNCQNNSPYYLCNDPKNNVCSSVYSCPVNANTTTFGYDGFTTVLQAKQFVELCKTYHLKLAISDVADPNYDSAVMIRAGSLRSKGVEIIPQSAYADFSANGPTAVEGCLDAKILFKLNQPAASRVVNHFTLAGTAINGTDYSFVTDSVVFQPGDTAASVTIHPLQDNIIEGTESVLIIPRSLCTGLPMDTVYLYIADEIYEKVSNDTAVCVGNSVTLHVTDNSLYTYNWSPAQNLSCATCSTVVVSPAASTKYFVNITMGSCSAEDSVSVTVVDIIPDAGPDINVCKGASAILNATGGTLYKWKPAAGLNNPEISNPVASPAVTTTYTVEVSEAVGCQQSDSLIVTVLPEFTGAVSRDTTICKEGTANLRASGGVSYLWLPATGLSNSTVASTTAAPENPTTYTVVITNADGCEDTLSSVVDFYSESSVTVSAPQTIPTGQGIQLNASGGIIYEWLPDAFINHTDISSPYVNPVESTTYTVIITTERGCVFTKTIPVIVINAIKIFVPNAFSPDGNNNNDIFVYIAQGNFKLESFKVFNRWGEIVFKTETEGIGWNGRFNGMLESTGTYVYEIKGTDAENNSIIVKGNVTLIK